MISRNGKLGLHKRKVRKDGWTPTIRAKFLDALATTCNVNMALQTVNRTAKGVRALKQRDPEFARLWDHAFAIGRERLEEELIACALGQAPSGDNPVGDRDGSAVCAFDPDLALKVLQLGGRLSRGSRPRAGQLPSQSEVDAALMARLETLAARMAKS